MRLIARFSALRNISYFYFICFDDSGRSEKASASTLWIKWFVLLNWICVEMTWVCTEWCANKRNLCFIWFVNEIKSACKRGNLWKREHKARAIKIKQRKVTELITIHLTCGVLTTTNKKLCWVKRRNAAEMLLSTKCARLTCKHLKSILAPNWTKKLRRAYDVYLRWNNQKYTMPLNYGEVFFSKFNLKYSTSIDFRKISYDPKKKKDKQTISSKMKLIWMLFWHI